jgi:hypothetical protein
MGLTSGRRITITKTLARRPPSAAPASVWSLSYRHVTDRLTAVLRAEPAPRYVLGLDRPDAASIAARWQASGGTTRAVIGACYDGSFGVDLAKDGPHGLVAGTTGPASPSCCRP